MNAISFLIFHDRLYHMVWNNLLPVKLKFCQEINVQDVGNLCWNLKAPAYKTIKVYQSIYIVYILLQNTRWSDLKLIQFENLESCFFMNTTWTQAKWLLFSIMESWCYFQWYCDDPFLAHTAEDSNVKEKESCPLCRARRRLPRQAWERKWKRMLCGETEKPRQKKRGSR